MSMVKNVVLIDRLASRRMSDYSAPGPGQFIDCFAVHIRSMAARVASGSESMD